MLEQVFIFRISADSTVWAEPGDRPLSGPQLRAALNREAPPRKMMVQEVASVVVDSHNVFYQRFEADLVLGAVTTVAPTKRRFVFLELERVYARIKESGQGIIPSSLFREFVQGIQTEFLKAEAGGPLEDTQAHTIRQTLDVVSKPSQSASVRLKSTSRPSTEKQKNPFLPSDDDVSNEQATSPTPGKKQPTIHKKEGFLEDKITHENANKEPGASLRSGAAKENPQTIAIAFEDKGSGEEQVRAASKPRATKSKQKKSNEELRKQLHLEKKLLREEMALLNTVKIQKKQGTSSKILFWLLGLALILVGLFIVRWIPTLRTRPAP